MTRWSGALGAALAVCMGRGGQAQDSLPPPPVRHVLGLALDRVQPFQRSYDVNVVSGDSTTRIAQRDVALSETTLPDSTSGWLLTERRDGMVPGFDSLFLSRELRPVRWAAISGSASVEVLFADDSLHGIVETARSTKTFAAECAPDVIVSASMLELALSLVTLSAEWADSAHMLATTLAGAESSSVELIVMGEDSTVSPSGESRPVWLVGLNAGDRRAVYSVDKATGVVARSQQSLPSQAGAVLEYRERAISFAIPPQ